MTGFADAVARAAAAGRLVVQPRMGMASPLEMRAGLLAVRGAGATTVGTLTVDSYTRVGDHRAALTALHDGARLNGYPIVSHHPDTTRAVLDGLTGFPVQVRHGSADPRAIFGALAAAGLDATEGGPVSYCLPYSRKPLRDSVEHWTEACENFSGHLETFGGCMMGQLCPPGLLVALSVLEAVFFRFHGVRSVSLSYAQQTNADQDAEAIRALRVLAARFLSDVDWHVVVYAYMGVFPRTPAGARLLNDNAARLAVRAGAERLIVKTVAEAHRIPTVAENVDALESAAEAAALAEPEQSFVDTGVLAEATALVEAVLELPGDPGEALLAAFRRGLLDVPYCLHPDNAGHSRSHIDDAGRLRWSSVGAMPIPRSSVDRSGPAPDSASLLTALHRVAHLHDARTH
ncbi:methylaspartate mutase [Lentzea flaviverrucosa]|uniref:Glutamate mutase subunit E n=1 Tax=Lentzea flaviverrucosa TaxID=200379 RepID=A0A1H9GN56_9PSEU|nr:methylaspartate mutase [Lentzea flaviverrucosa]RDI34856.1 glutamate mutase subunit E [Lentzea flaviverrucosa]SEQ51433.1 Glutamate mutase subunit E [Lentzea flaviverrucosa]